MPGKTKKAKKKTKKAKKTTKNLKKAKTRRAAKKKQKKAKKTTKKKTPFSAFSKKFEPLKQLALQQWGYFKDPTWRIILRKAYEKNWGYNKLKKRILETKHPADVFTKSV